MKLISRFLLRWLWFAISMAAAVCCASSGSGDRSDSISSTDTDADTDADTDTDADSDADMYAGDGSGSAPGSECALANTTQPCCDGSGVQTCKADLTWSECDCTSSGQTNQTGDDNSDAGAADLPQGNQNIIPKGNLNTDIEFEWDETQATPGTCEPGRYEGTYQGIYGFQTRKSNLGGSIAMNLSEEGNGEIFTIENGTMSGDAKVVIPFHATVTGKLDCSTAKLDSIIDGVYNTFGLKHPFAGTMTAEYNKNTHALINGTWEVKKKDDPTIGGHGTWQAKWKP